jgi:hypothetical protein
LASIDDHLLEIRSDLREISNQIDIQRQIDFYHDAYALHIRLKFLTDAIAELSHKEQENLKNSDFSFQIRLITERFAEIAPNAGSISQRANAVSFDLALGVYLLANIAKSLMALSSRFISPTEFAVAQLTIWSFVHELQATTSRLASTDGPMAGAVNRARQDYTNALNRLVDRNSAFQAFSQLKNAICVETRHRGGIRQVPEDRFYPRDYYAIRDRETGILGPIRYAEGYMHFKASEVDVKPIILPLNGIDIVAGVAEIREKSFQRSPDSRKDCEVLLEDRDSEQWIEMQRLAFNKALGQLEPQVLRLIATSRGRELMNETSRYLAKSVDRQFL